MIKGVRVLGHPAPLLVSKKVKHRGCMGRNSAKFVVPYALLFCKDGNVGYLGAPEEY